MTTHAPEATDRSHAAARLAELPGIEFLRAIGRGELPAPPAGQLLGIEPVALEPGAITFQMAAREAHYNPMGVVHGGILATLLDTAMGCAVHSVLPAGVGYTTIEFKVNFVRAATVASGRLRAEGRLVHEGGRTAVAEGRVHDERGRLVAHATTTCMILRPDAREARAEAARS